MAMEHTSKTLTFNGPNNVMTLVDGRPSHPQRGARSNKCLAFLCSAAPARWNELCNVTPFWFFPSGHYQLPKPFAEKMTPGEFSGGSALETEKPKARDRDGQLYRLSNLSACLQGCVCAAHRHYSCVRHKHIVLTPIHCFANPLPLSTDLVDCTLSVFTTSSAVKLPVIFVA